MGQKKQPPEKFEQLSNYIKEIWSRLSDDDVALANGKENLFLGKLQEKYGLSKEDAHRRFEALRKSCGYSSDKAI